MSFESWKMYIVAESQLAVTFQAEKQPYSMFISFENSRYQIDGVFHEGTGECLHCHQRINDNYPSQCFCFLVNVKCILELEKETEANINKALAFNGISLSLKRNRAERAKQYLARINALFALSTKAQESVLFYDPEFTYYITLKGRESCKVDLTGNVSAYLEGENSQLIVARELFQYLEKSQTKKLKVLETEIMFTHDLIGNKKTKLPLVIESIKKSIRLFEEIAPSFQSESFQQLIAYLNEVLYREISLDYENQEQFIAMHEQTASTIYEYAYDAITYEECEDRIFDSAKQGADSRKDRVIFAIKSLRMLEKVFQSIQDAYTAKAYVWFQAVFHKMFNYLRLELGITFETDLVVRQGKDEFLHHTLRAFFAGKLEEVDAYEQIDEQLPYIHSTSYQQINELLQMAAKEKEGHVYYLMEIPFLDTLEASLQQHEAYQGIDRIKAEFVNFEEQDSVSPLLQWLDDEKQVRKLVTLIGCLLEDKRSKSWGISITPSRPSEANVTEYILFDGEKLYRLHFRENN